MTATRGTTNKNVSGNSYDRRRRKLYLLDAYRADVDVERVEWQGQLLGLVVRKRGEGEKACRCYRCGRLLDYAALTVDRIIPGCHGGTYRRDNIRPACGHCNSSTGGALRSNKPMVLAVAQ